MYCHIYLMRLTRLPAASLALSREESQKNWREPSDRCVIQTPICEDIRKRVDLSDVLLVLIGTFLYLNKLALAIAKFQ